jgi:hypothetical protein
MLTGHICRELYKQAGTAQAYMERVEDLSLVELLRGDVGLTERRHTQVNEGACKIRAAQATYS